MLQTPSKKMYFLTPPVSINISNMDSMHSSNSESDLEKLLILNAAVAEAVALIEVAKQHMQELSTKINSKTRNI